MAKKPKITEKDIPYLKSRLRNHVPMSTIGEHFNINYRTVSYYIRKLGLFNYVKAKDARLNPITNEFEVIDTPEKAYILGFVLGDGSFTGKKGDILDISVSLKDKCILEFISKQLKVPVHSYYTFNKKTRTFPHCRLVRKVPFILKHLGGKLKPERHYPRIRKDLERYLLLGFFDADGCISYGRRKDRNRFWSHISFTHHLKCLSGLQTFLSKQLNITTMVRPKSQENAYVLSFANKKDVIKFLDFIYPNNDFVILSRKYEKAKAVRLEWGDNGEGAIKQ